MNWVGRSVSVLGGAAWAWCSAARLGRAGSGVCFVALAGCAGSGEPAPATASDALSETATEADAPAQSDESTSEAPAPVDPCAGGTCTHCGDAVCLSSFYCDEGAQACAWLPACAKEPSCDCLQKALPGCSCEAREGGLFVRCD